MDYLMLSVGNNLDATDGIFLSRVRNYPQEYRKIPQKGRTIPSTRWKCPVSSFSCKMALNKLFN
jgi:hypothetical protein